MNRSINLMLGFFLFPAMLIAIFVGFDLPIEFLRVSGHSLPYKSEIFLGFGLLFAILILRRSIRRWMGMRIVSKVKKFKWNAAVSKQRKVRVTTYLLLEAMVMLFVSIAFYNISVSALPIAIAFMIGVVDNLVFMMVGANSRFRVGLSSKALIVADREVTLLYFTGLRRISLHQQTVYFDYIKGLQLSFPLDCIQEDMREEFFTQLEGQVDRDRVFFSKKMA